MSSSKTDDMEAEGQFGVKYTEDFTIACTINNLEHEAVLQYFIDRVSFYAFNGGDVEAVSLWATHIVLDCKRKAGAQIVPVKDKRIQKISLRYIRLLSDLINNIHLSTVEKMKESISLMREWEAEMPPNAEYPTTFFTDQHKSVLLTFDFNLLCNMNGIVVQQVLQFFIDEISFPRQRAVPLSATSGSSASMSFFEMMLMSRSMQRTKNRGQQEIDQLYNEQLLQLDETLKDESDEDRRLTAYREFYTKWYNSLRKKLT